MMNEKKILIIDDERSLVDALADLFTPRGCKVLQAVRGSGGLDIAFKERPDLVILDLRMPGISGEAVLRELKANLPQIKVLVYTAWTGDEVRQKALELGADDYMEKPADLELLQKRAMRLMEA